MVLEDTVSKLEMFVWILNHGQGLVCYIAQRELSELKVYNLVSLHPKSIKLHQWDLS